MTPPNWQGQTAVIVCAGPSLSDEQLAIIHASNAKTIGVNTAYRYMPWMDTLYGGDFMFWRVHHARIKQLCPWSQLWTCDGAAEERYQINRQRAGNREGLGREVIHMNGNSGAQAINLAFLWGARKIVMVGFDMKRGPHGERHRHGDHEKSLVQNQCFEEWILKGKKLAEDLKACGIDAVNCTPGSAWPWFRMSTVEEELK